MKTLKSLILVLGVILAWNLNAEPDREVTDGGLGVKEPSPQAAEPADKPATPATPARPKTPSEVLAEQAEQKRLAAMPKRPDTKDVTAAYEAYTNNFNTIRDTYRNELRKIYAVMIKADARNPELDPIDMELSLMPDKSVGQDRPDRLDRGYGSIAIFKNAACLAAQTKFNKAYEDAQKGYLMALAKAAAAADKAGKKKEAKAIKAYYEDLYINNMQRLPMDGPVEAIIKKVFDNPAEVSVKDTVKADLKQDTRICDKDKRLVWTEIPEDLAGLGLHFSMYRDAGKARTDFKVGKAGYVMMACPSIRTVGCMQMEGLEKDGWQHLPIPLLKTSSGDMAVLVRFCKSGEEFSIQTEMHRAPVILTK